MAAKMTEAARERLREIAAAKKGRTTLKGLNPQGWAAALDEIADATGSAGEYLLHAQYRAAINAPDVFPTGYALGHDLGIRWNYSTSDRQKTTAGCDSKELVSHVALRYATVRQHADLIRVLEGEAVPIVQFKFNGINNEPAALFLYPLRPILALMCAIWPDAEKDKTAEKVRKYLFGYTPRMVRDSNPNRSNVAVNNPHFFRTVVEKGTSGPPEFAQRVAAGDHAAAVKRLRDAGLLPPKA